MLWTCKSWHGGCRFLSGKIVSCIQLTKQDKFRDIEQEQGHCAEGTVVMRHATFYLDNFQKVVDKL